MPRGLAIIKSARLFAARRGARAGGLRSEGRRVRATSTSRLSRALSWLMCQGHIASEPTMNIAATAEIAAPLPRHKTVPVDVGGVTVGGGAPIVVQSMTTTDTADVESTARQVAALAQAGSEIVRITVDRDEAAAAVPHIKERLLQMGVTAPIVGDFHYIGHKLLADYQACAEAL